MENKTSYYRAQSRSIGATVRAASSLTAASTSPAPFPECILKRKKEKRKEKRNKRTYNTRDSLVVTDPTTSLALLKLIC
jgi:hypothetical protein